VKEHPLIFKGELIQAMLELRKTNTRRVIPWDWFRCLDPEDPEDAEKAVAYNRYGQPGDRIWVKETWKYYARSRKRGKTVMARVLYRADGLKSEICLRDEADIERARAGGPTPGWRSPIHMPKVYSRLILEIKRVWLERLHEIDGDGAIAEGVILQPNRQLWRELTEYQRDQYRTAALERFRQLWDLINGPRGFGWDQNPYVFAIDYRVVGMDYSHCV